MDAAEVGGHDAANGRIAGAGLVHDVEALAARDTDVDDEPVVRKPLETLDGIREGLGLDTYTPNSAESMNDRLPMIGISIDDKYGRTETVRQRPSRIAADAVLTQTLDRVCRGALDSNRRAIPGPCFRR
jgi:hypothetical protein